MSYTDQNFETAASHTPGPWRTAVCPSDRTPLVKAGTLTVCSMAEGDENEHLADQRLIAAAPDLLAACESVRNWSEQGGEDLNQIEAAMGLIRAAIAKATQP